MKTIHLYGALKDKLGQKLRLDIESAAELIRALATIAPEAIGIIREGSFVLVRRKLDGGKRFTLKELGGAIRDTAHQLDIDTLHLGLGAADLHVIPVVAGRGGRGGVGKVLLGVAMVAGAWVTAGASLSAAPGVIGAHLGASAFSVLGASVSFGQIAMMGAVLALSGMSQMLSKAPKAAGSDTSQSYIFTGPTNTSAQGSAVPVVHGGPIRVGSLTISSSITNVRQTTAPAAFSGISGSVYRTAQS